VEFSFEALLETAHELADAASGVTLSHFRCNSTADDKGGGDFDPVTIADKGAEQAMRDIISRKYPDHGIAGEEFENVNENADFVWSLDPIDGTRSFILGLPLWGTLIGLRHQGKPILGIMDQPFTGERFWNDERAAWYRGPKGLSTCRTRACAGLGKAYLAATTPDMFKGEDLAHFNALAKAVRMRRFGGDCYLYTMLALGHIDIVAEASLKPFDIVPLIPIVEKAGGVVAEWGGKGGGRYIACGDPGLLDAARAVLEAGSAGGR
jgi:histidinol phosphatase-like enzyme (inositol monophosphatase family)